MSKGGSIVWMFPTTFKYGSDPPPLKVGRFLQSQFIFSGVKLKGMEHVPNIFMSFHKYLFLEVINILI